MRPVPTETADAYAYRLFNTPFAIGVSLFYNLFNLPSKQRIFPPFLKSAKVFQQFLSRQTFYNPTRQRPSICLFPPLVIERHTRQPMSNHRPPIITLHLLPLNAPFAFLAHISSPLHLFTLALTISLGNYRKARRIFSEPKEQQNPQ
jgi:hypothetical protein